MGNNEDARDFLPSVAIAPGETVRENMRFLGMNQRELAIRLQITQKHLSNMINAKAPITYETALRLEAVIGASAQFWLNLESNYQLQRTRIMGDENLESDLALIDKIPYTTMSDNGWVPVGSDTKERVYHCRRFFGVASLGAVKPTYEVAFKNQVPLSEYGVLAWLRKAEIEGLHILVEPFSKRKLKALIPTFQTLITEEPAVISYKLPTLFASCGIAFVLVDSLPNTDLSGATLWRNHTAIVALSNKEVGTENFWRTLFAAVARLLQQHTKKVHLIYELANPPVGGLEKAGQFDGLYAPVEVVDDKEQRGVVRER